jgi:hypothetical protein
MVFSRMLGSFDGGLHRMIRAAADGTSRIEEDLPMQRTE